VLFKGAGFDFSGCGLSLMRNPLRRFYGRGDLHFVTFSHVSSVLFCNEFGFDQQVTQSQLNRHAAAISGE